MAGHDRRDNPTRFGRMIGAFESAPGEYAPRVRSAAASRRLLFLTIAAGALQACAPEIFEGGIQNPSTGARVAALAEVERSRDRAAIPHVVECLASNDVVVRKAAIRCLSSLTGQTLDYRADDPPLQRAVAVDRWVEWCHRQDLVKEGASIP